MMEQKLSRTAKIVRHKGVEIIITDYSGLKGRELVEAMKENTKIIVLKIRGRRDCVMVSLFKNCLLDGDSANYMTKIKKAKDGTFVASALVGMSAIQKAALEITGILKKSSVPTEFFDGEEEAMDWVAEQYKKSVNRSIYPGNG